MPRFWKVKWKWEKFNIKTRMYFFKLDIRIPKFARKPFYYYPVFFVVLIPLLISYDAKSEISFPQVIDVSIWLAFVSSMIMITVSFMYIHLGRNKVKCAKCKIPYGEHYDDIIPWLKEKYKITFENFDHDWTSTIRSEDGPKDTEEEKTKAKQAGLIFATLYGLVAAIAITNALDLFMDEETIFHFPNGLELVENFSKTDSIPALFYILVSQEFFLLASFFVIGTLFYHCGLVFFTEEASHILHTERSAGKVAFSSLLLFVCGILLYFAAGTVSSLLQFSLWIWMLMLIDLVWILFNSNTDLRGYMHWIHFDIIIFIFLLVILIGSPTQGEDYPNYYYYHLLVLFVFLYRTLLDYKLSWKFFGQFKISA